MFGTYRKVLGVSGAILCLFSSVFAYSGGSGEPNDPYQIATVSDWNDLMNTPADCNKCFIMTADVNLQGIVLTPVGNSTNKFTGVFDGNGQSISNLSIECDGLGEAGLFGKIDDANASVENLTLLNPNVDAHDTMAVGALVGFLNYGTVRNCGVRGGSVSGGGGGGDSAGGLVGGVWRGRVLSSYSNTFVNGYYNVGGLVGLLLDSFSTLSDCYATGVVSGNKYVGGLIGFVSGSRVYNCYAAALVDSNLLAGGFAGQSDGGSYYGCFWDRDIDTEVNAVGGWAGPEPLITGKTTAEMQDVNTFLNAGWDFNTPIWKICNHTNYPKLAWQIPLPGDFVCPDGVDIYDLAVFADQWLLEKLSVDVAPGTGDGIINFIDWAVFANGWQGNMNDVGDFTSQWLKSSAYCADIAPAGGDGVVNMPDFAAFAENWLVGLMK